MTQALELLQLVKRNVSGRSNVELCKNQVVEIELRLSEGISK